MDNGVFHFVEALHNPHTMVLYSLKAIGVKGDELELTHQMLGVLLGLDDHWDSPTLAAGVQ